MSKTEKRVVAVLMVVLVTVGATAPKWVPIASVVIVGSIRAFLNAPL